MPPAERNHNAAIRITTFLLGLLALFSLAGCGSESPTVTPTQQAVVASPTAAAAQATSTEQPVAATATVAVAATGAITATPRTEATLPPAGTTFTNPVLRRDFPDPFVLDDNGTYYAYATNTSGMNIQAARSTTLVDWELLTDAMPALPTWAKLGGSLVWAPEVIKIGDKYVMYYTARDKASNKQCVGAATADKPDAKFKDNNTAPLVCQADLGGTIDPDPFRDGDKLYLYYKNDGNCCGMPTRIWVQELGPDGLSLTGEPAPLIENNVGWEGRVIEAPTMWKHDNQYYLFFSANNYAGFEYAVGYASCEAPTGPCVQAPENPILASRMQQKPLVIGPGHQSLLQVGDQTWIVYHVWDVLTSGLRGSNRFMYIDKLDWQAGKPVIKGPTTDPQPMPGT
ncbi:MAG: glycoside hydrolase family 43 protein [Chloroflexota bacterium]